MALSNSFGAANFTKADIEALIAELDADPANKNKIAEFGNSLSGQWPFPLELYKAAKREMLRRYHDVHIASAESEANTTQSTAAREVADNMRDAKETFDKKTDRVIAYILLTEAIIKQRNDEWRELLRQAGEPSKKFKYDQRRKQVKEEAETARRQARTMIQASDVMRRHIQDIIDDQSRIVGVIAQTGNLAEPVSAPKIARFKPRKP